MYLNAVAYPSGGGMGHALWIVSDSTHRIGYASWLAPTPEPGASGASGAGTGAGGEGGEGGGFALEFEPGTLAGLSALVLGPGCSRCQQQQQQRRPLPLSVGPRRGGAAPVPQPAAALIAPHPSGLGLGQAPLPGQPSVSEAGLPGPLSGPEDALPLLDVPTACLRISDSLKGGGSIMVAVAASGERQCRQDSRCRCPLAISPTICSGMSLSAQSCSTASI